ncbi:MBL fold metallo-hydrolase [Rhodococcus sp. USK13]|uniref:MBL fold metallo-hydrolase n=1 Tax=Rhodococcus sp. USK13 TaxID=2806442 RepID=UPI001BCB857D|nr:MBL fold metallo-hydrolase [Rhodococcus sp. USK13]
MRRISKNVTAEFYYWGCNPAVLHTSDGAILFDTPQQPIDAVRWREQIIERSGRIRYLVNTEPHADHTQGNAYFPGVEVVGQRGLAVRYAKDLNMLPAITGEPHVEHLKRSDPDSVWLAESPDYPANPPTTLFDDELVLQIGDHEVRILHHPGHTAMQTAIHIPSEHVVITGDNVFSGVRTFLQEADPWALLQRLEDLRGLDVETIIPGHGEPVGVEYLVTQEQIIRNWLGTVESFVDKGLTLADAFAQPLDVKRDIDPYEMDQRLWQHREWLNRANIANLYDKVCRARGVESDLGGYVLYEDLAMAQEIPD